MIPIPVFIDTDIGDDIDDAIALTYALLNPNFRVVGVSTVGYEGSVRAGIVKALLEATESKALVVAGSEGASTNAETTYSGQIRWAARDLTPYRSSVEPSELLYRLALEHVGQLHLVTLGPLTNIQKAFERYPQLPDLLAGVHIMGGEIDVLRREHNFAADYVAAARVLQQGKNVHLSTWTVGTRLRFEHDLIRGLEFDTRPHAQLLTRLIAAWAQRHAPVLYDLVPFMHLERPAVVPSHQMRIVVETEGVYTRGVSVDVAEYATGLPLHVHLGNQPKGSAVLVSRDIVVSEARTMLAEVLGASDWPQGSRMAD